MHSSFLQSLRDIVGPANVLVGPDLSAYERAWRGPYAGQALAVVRPGDTAQVAAVVKACAAASVPIIPQGGNTGLVGGSIPDASGTQVVLQLGRMNVVRKIDVENLTVTVEAGCVLAAVQEMAHEAGYMFPLSLGAEGSCMIGGNLATNAGGTQVLRYGNARELCLGIEVVTPQGEVLSELSGLRKDNTGYDLRNLFIGSEGTLGVITAATMKLVARPAAVLTAWAAAPALDGAVALLRAARDRLGMGLTGFEVMNRASLELVHRHLPHLKIPFGDDLPACSVLIECSDAESEHHARVGFEALLQEGLEQQWISDAVIAESEAQSQQMWAVREHIPMAQGKDDPCVAHDISLPISKVVAFVDACSAALQQAIPGARIVNLGHLGDGNLHFNVQGPIGGDHAAFAADAEAVNSIVYLHVSRLGGSISAEHGVGMSKREALQVHKSAAALQLMRVIKQAIDPANLMNPGRVLAQAP